MNMLVDIKVDCDGVKISSQGRGHGSSCEGLRSVERG